MELNLIYGKSGTGKSKYIYDDIKQNLGKKKIFLIVPEQCNLSAEKKLFDVLQTDSLINVEVLTLSRMAYRVSGQVGKSLLNHLSKPGKDMLIFDLISKEKKNLNFLGKSEKNIETVSNMYSELKKHKINLIDLKNAKIEDEYTKLKLKDIEILYEKYEERLKNNFIDENDILTDLSENLEKSNMFDDSLIYIDEFLGFTPQEYSIFEKLIKKAEKVSVTISADNLNNNLNKENDIFYFNKIFAKKLSEIANKNNVKINEINLNKTFRFKSEELKFLEENFSSYTNKYEKECGNIKLFLANNQYTEIENVARTIHNLVRKSGYCYREIGIITEDTEKYSEDAKSIFAKYDIPIFVDEKKSLNQNILIKFIIAMLDVLVKSWSFESVLNYLKIGLLDISSEEIFEFENYCIKWGIKGSKFYNREFDYEPINDKQETLESIRKKIVEPLMEFKENVLKLKTAEEITKQIYSFIIKNNINKNLDDKLKSYGKHEISDEYNTSYKILVNILDDICVIFKEEKINFEKYKELLEVGFSSSELGIIPAFQDQVIMGDTERTRSNKLKIVFVIGINDGYFPNTNKSEGYLNDSDRKYLSQAEIELAKDSIDTLYEEQFNIYRSLTVPEEKLFLSYSSSDKEGKSIRPSILIKKIKRMFPNIKEESDIIERKYDITNEKATFEDALSIYKEFLDGKDIDIKWQEILMYFYKKEPEKFEKIVSAKDYTNMAEDISEENIKRLYGNNLQTSISKLENYRRCPFSFHLTYGLKIKEKQTQKIESIDTGSFMHEVIDLFFRYLDENSLGIKEIEENQIQKIVDEIVDMLLQMSKYYTFTSTPKFKLLTKRLKKVVYKSICYIVYSLRHSDFSVLGHEIEFSNTGKYEPIKLELEDKKVEITGKIDRIDIAKLSENQYVRIIDYKSSSKNIDLAAVKAGLQIQLITYLDAICEQTGLNPSGVLYLGLIENVLKGAKNLTEEQIESKLRSNFRMKGLVLADVNIIKMMDNKLEKGASDIIPVELKQDGTIGQRSSTIKKEEFEELKKEVKNVIKEISKEILRGKINIKPYSYDKKTGCDYCKYKTICMFNSNMKENEYNYI